MLEQIGHYSLANPASVYDEEALTALELAGRTAAKVNETVAAFNTLEAETNEHLEDQDKKIDDEFAEQNAAIDEMNSKTMPAKVVAEMDKRINDGTFTQKINEYAGNLSERVNNLLGTLPEGATTMDAEVIDARTDLNGVAWASLGDHVRSLNALDQLTFRAEDYLLADVDYTERNGFYHHNGTWYDNESYRCLEVDVEPGQIYLAQSAYGWDAPEAICFNASGEILQVYSRNHTNVTRDDYKTPIVIPAGGARLAVNTQYTYSYKGLKRVVSGLNTAAQVGDFVRNATAATRANDNEILSGDITGDITAAAFINGSFIITTVTGEQAYKYYTGLYPVDAGHVYRVKGSANWGNIVCVFLHDGVVMRETAVKAASRVTFDASVLAPMGATHILVANEDAVVPSVRQVLGYDDNANATLEWEHLKWVCLGDSLTEANVRTSKHYHSYVKDKTGIDVVNMGVSGTGYYNRKDSNNAFYQRVLAMPADADVVTIFGSGNDLGFVGDHLGNPTDEGTDTICGCINTCLDNIYSVNPVVQVGIVSPTPWNGNTPDNDTCAMALYSAALKEICRLRGIPFLDLFHTSGYRPNDAEYRKRAFSKDPEGIANHPDETGHKIISGQFYAFLQKLIGTY